jgi:hypothetical protein
MKKITTLIMMLFITASFRIMQHLHHSFNENGDIVREDYYFNPASLPK